MDIKKHTCNICNKDYKTYKSMWHHKKHIHINEKNNDQKMTNCDTQNDQCMTQIDDIINSDVESETVSKLTDNKLCIYCNKHFSAYTHMRRHLKTCKLKDNIIKENEELKLRAEKQEKDMIEMKKSLDDLKKQMLEMMNKKCKMHPKTLQKMINSNNNSNNNITINNNIQYVELGDEQLDKIFSKKEKMKILCEINSMDKLIKHTHLNKDYPQFQNIIITNAKGSQAYTYNKTLKKFVLCDKMELLEEMILYRFDDLIAFYNECKDKINSEQKEMLEKLFLLKYNDKYYVDTSKEFNVIIYNECNKEHIKNKLIENISDNELDL